MLYILQIFHLQFSPKDRKHFTKKKIVDEAFVLIGENKLNV